MTLGDRVAVLRDGTVQQCDTPERLFDAPANVFVAAFMGSPADEPRRPSDAAAMRSPASTCAGGVERRVWRDGARRSTAR